MKKIIVLMIFLWVIMIPQMNAQKTSSFVFKLGPKAGLNVGWLSNKMDVDPNFGAHIGFNAGVVANMRWGQRHLSSPFGTGYFGLQPEVLFSYQGAKCDGKNINLGYLVVPIMCKFYATTKFNIELGPEFAFLVSRSPNTIAFESTEIDLSNIKGGMDVLLGVGVGYDFDMGLSLGARYNLGFSELAGNLPWKNSVVQITLSWLFTL